MKSQETKLKRRRIFKETTLKGQLVAKSYVDLDFRNTVSKHFIYYSQISYKVIGRELVCE